MITELPSGLKVELRKLRGQELIDLAERARSNAPQRISQIVAPCSVAVIDPGPYPFVLADKPVPWGKLLRGDLIAALLALRVASVPDGDVYDFPVRCERDECHARYEWRIQSITNDLPVRRLSDEAKARLASGDARFEAHTLSGVRVTYKLMTEEDDEPIRKLMKLLERKAITMVETLAAQTRSIEGVTEDPNDIRKRQRFFASLDYDELLDLRQKLDEQDCGVDSEIRTTCTECGWEQDLNLPFGKTFFMPGKPKKTPLGSSSDLSSPG